MTTSPPAPTEPASQASPPPSDVPPREVLGVGIIGAGPVTQAIHLPTLARLTDSFAVVRVLDVDAAVAASVASRVGAAWTTDLTELLDDPAVDVVAICSPHTFHAEQVIAACRAGKKAVLCEKPFAMTGDEASRIAAVAAETGVPIVVGAMHAFDAGWLAADAAAVRPQTIRSSIVLPPNPRFEDFATEVLTRPTASASDLTDPDVAAGALFGGVMGLAIHDLPLIRSLLGRVSPTTWQDAVVVSAEPLAPFGYLVVIEAGPVTIELHALMSSNWAPRWILEATGTDATGTTDTTGTETTGTDVAIEVTFTPSYVHAGSGSAVVHRAGASVTHRPADHNGYEGEWRHLADLAHGRTEAGSTTDLVDDLRFALSLAAQASDAARAAAVDASTTTAREAVAV